MWVLTTAAIAGWWSTFDGAAWLLVGAAGAAVGAGLVLLHHWKGTLVWAILTVPIAYLVLGVGLLGVEFGGNGAPRIDSLTRVISGAWESWSLLVGTHPPVEATGAVLLAPALAGVLTRRSPRPWRSPRRVPVGRSCRCSCCSPACS